MYQEATLLWLIRELPRCNRQNGHVKVQCLPYERMVKIKHHCLLFDFSHNSKRSGSIGSLPLELRTHLLRRGRDKFFLHFSDGVWINRSIAIRWSDDDVRTFPFLHAFHGRF
jgi:hypothetical protein